MITKNISQGDEIETDKMSLTLTSRIATSSFDYNVGDFEDFGDEDVEEWDAKLEKKLNITIQRCNNGRPNGDAPFVSENDPSPLNMETSATALPGHLSNGNISFQDAADVQASDPMRRSSQPHISRWATGPQHGNLVEAKLRN
ncbi:hypothetical protein BWQ96_00815 [Gracilariopsis chorda]|uniref:Uncharacterized protein n=1 Tax=Gracilariopsis chorda TaxID=448386 RepID=A0A2V3J527_9FLOR|nr:hypothetical protein BWQ96_00815 [Gracilariopsis chorda]|eukprot:PXF49499.1 hypothetical protein BWQ96_00815 [Gracilariopsis chorda]